MKMKVLSVIMCGMVLSVLLATQASALTVETECDPGSGECDTEEVIPEMPVKNLGTTGLKVSALALGAWITFGNSLGTDTACALMEKSFDHGIFTFDNAEAYAKGKAEEVMGECIRRGIESGKWKRSDLVIMTKIFWGGQGANDMGLSRKHLLEGAAASLDRLGLEYVDVLFAHRPDPETPLEETVRAFNYLLDSNRILYWGTSEWSADQIAEAKGIANRLDLVGPVVEQPEYSLLRTARVEEEYSRLYASGLGITAYSSLASGLLTGKYASGIPPNSRFATEPRLKTRYQERFPDWDSLLASISNLSDFAAGLELCSTTQLALAWAMSNPHVSTVLLGATSIAQLEENILSVRCLASLTSDDISAVESIMSLNRGTVVDWKAHARARAKAEKEKAKANAKAAAAANSGGNE